MDPYVVDPHPRRGRWWWAAAWLALVGAIAGGALALGDGAATPEERLAEVVAFVREHRTARFEETTRTELERPEGFPDVEGDVFPDVHESRGEGELDLGRAMRSRTEQDKVVFETITLEDASYSRTTFEGETTAWQRYPADDEEGDRLSIFTQVLEQQREEDEAAASGESSGSFEIMFAASSEQWVDELLTELAEVGTTTSPSPGTIRITYRQRAFLDDEELGLLDQIRDEAFRSQFDDEREVVVEHGPDGRLDVVRQVQGGSTSVTRYHDWGMPVRIEAPPAGEVDVTPAIDEEDLAAFGPVPIHSPTDLPPGWELLSGYVNEYEEEEPDCTYATLSFGPADTDHEPLASVAVVPGACQLLEGVVDPASGEPVRLGERDAFLHGNDDFAWFTAFVDEPLRSAAVPVPGGWVLVSTSEGDDVLARLVSSLQPGLPRP